MAKRISELSKELNVTSKVIIEKCLAEGVPPDKAPKSHTSTVSAGLEASIREWFSSAAVATAVETGEHVDLEKVRTKPVKKARSSKNGEVGQTAVAEPGGIAPSQPVVVETAAAAQAASSHAAPAQAATSHATPAQPAPVAAAAASAGAAEAAPAAPPADPGVEHIKATPIKPTPAAPARPLTPAKAPSLSPIKIDAIPAAPSAPAASDAPAAPAAAGPAPLAPAASAPATPGGAAPIAASSVVPAAPAAGGATGRPRGEEPPSGPARPAGAPGPVNPAAPRPPVVRGPAAPMNVPRRPTVVAPAGPQLQVKKAAALTGPKVIRVEAPEPADTSGPRRPAAGGGSRGFGGRGVIGTSGGDADSRSPRRRNDRRTPGPAGGGADAASAARRRVKGGEELPAGSVFREQDLVEREARLARAGGYLKQRRREAKAREHAAGERAQTAAETGGKVKIRAPFTIKELAEATGVKAAEIIKKLFVQKVLATINSGIDEARAADIMMDFDIELDVIREQTAEEVVSAEFDDRKMIDERPRSPVVTIMGHVDHGKTSLLDRIRSANVAAGEAGGITQKTSAFRVPVKVGDVTKHIVFLDTPGHQAFTEMRARGANLTDVVVLVVSAPDGVMPQTVESINHARAAKVPIVIAMNKVDSPLATDSQIQKVFGRLAENNLSPVEWGGETELVRTSAIKGTGIQELLETLDLQAQVLDLKADFAGPARGRVIEATREEGRGCIATILVQDGELKVGDFIVVGRAFGRVRDITDDQGKRLKNAGPSMPVQISGLDLVPDAGDSFFVTDSLRKAEEAAEQRRQREREAALHVPKVTLDTVLMNMKDANVKEILIVLKADLQGSVDVIKNEVERLSTPEVKIRVLHAAVGGITEADVQLADASKAVVVGFNVVPSGKATAMADAKGVEIRTYDVIYDITADVKKAAEGKLEPEIRQEVLGHAEVRQVFKVTRVGTIAGCYITDGMVQRDALIRVTRNGIVIEQDRVLEQLKRFKDDAKDVKAGMECGMKIVGYDDIKEGDVLECYRRFEVKRTL